MRDIINEIKEFVNPKDYKKFIKSFGNMLKDLSDDFDDLRIDIKKIENINKNRNINGNSK